MCNWMISIYTAYTYIDKNMQIINLSNNSIVIISKYKYLELKFFAVFKSVFFSIAYPKFQKINALTTRAIPTKVT